MRPRHPKKDVEAGLARILADPWWRLEMPTKTGHVWAELKCGHGSGGCIVWIWSSPSSPSAHAKRIITRRGGVHTDRERYT